MLEVLPELLWAILTKRKLITTLPYSALFPIESFQPSFLPTIFSPFSDPLPQADNETWHVALLNRHVWVSILLVCLLYSDSIVESIHSSLRARFLVLLHNPSGLTLKPINCTTYRELCQELRAGEHPIKDVKIMSFKIVTIDRIFSLIMIYCGEEREIGVHNQQV